MRLTLILFTALALGESAFAAFSFKPIACDPLPSDVLESAICTSDEAVRLDRAIADQLNVRIPLCDLESIKAHQRKFLAERNLCSDGGNFITVQSCVEVKLEERLEDLKADAATGYYCP